MPNGVIWGGAVEGSNQLGATVTCQAMTARPAGAAAVAGTTPEARRAMVSDPASVPRQRCSPNDGQNDDPNNAMGDPPCTNQSQLEWRSVASNSWGGGWSIADVEPRPIGQGGGIYGARG